MEIIKGYRENEELRHSFNELAGRIFDLDFEPWYLNGFWKDEYIPYSVIENGRVAANVSVNICNVLHRGREIRLIQLGTVMTDPDFRGRGYSRLLIEEVLKDYSDRVDGFYLFANDRVLDFYPKFGFVKRDEYRYEKNVLIKNDAETVPVSMETPEDWAKMVKVINEKGQIGSFSMTGNSGLLMYYLSQFMRDTVFYIPGCDSYAVAETEGGTLTLHAIFGDAAIDDVVSAFGSRISRIELCFTPENTSGYKRNMVREEDTTLFVRGSIFDELKDFDFMFQTITHA